MTLSRFCRALRACLLAFLPVFLLPIAQAQAARKTVPETSISDARADPEAKRAEWFLRGRIVPGKSSAELRRRAYQAKMQARARATLARANSQPPTASGGWTSLGPVPLASDA